MDCSEGESDNTNKLTIEDVEYIDDTIKPILLKE